VLTSVEWSLRGGGTHDRTLIDPGRNSCTGNKLSSTRLDVPSVRVVTTIANGLIEFVSRAEGPALALLVFLLVFGESLIITDLIVPGEVGLVVAGAAAASNGTPIGYVIAAAALGAVAGDTAGYLVGRKVGTDRLLDHRWGRRLRPTLKRARQHFDDHGISTVAAARWVGALRGVVPVVAGSSRLSAPRFYAASVPSATIWSSTMALLGYVWGDDIADVVDRVGLVVSGVVIAALVAVVLWSRHRREASAGS
jgi:membrane-associated protein